jgi:uncharacterized protein YbdZ (MbtH family)
LPQGWERKFDSKSKRVFYVDNINKTTSWDPPADDGAAPLERVPSAPAAAVASAEAKIPEGFEAKVDGKGRTYYVDHFLKATSWDKPEALPAGWERAFDSRKNKIYYIDHINKKTQWTLPSNGASVKPAAAKPVVKAAPVATPVVAAPSMPGGWEKCSSKDGRTYYVDHFTKTTSWNPPAPLPEGWDRRLDPASNRVFYANTVTKVTQWDPPVAVQAQITSSSFAGSSISSAGYGGNRYPVAAAPAAPVRTMKLPEGYERGVDPRSGKVYHIDHFLKTTTWDTPKEIPSDWERAFDARSGRVYYVDHTNKKTQYEHPCP